MKVSIEDREPVNRLNRAGNGYPQENEPEGTESNEEDENESDISGGSDWITSLKHRGFLVNKYTWNKGTKRQRMFFLDPGDNGRGGIDYDQAVIYWVKKKSKNPGKDKRQHRMIYLKEITKITAGKTTRTFEQADAQSAREERCLSLHFKAVTRKPKPRDKPETEEDNDMIAVPRTLDLEVESEELCKRIVLFITKFIKKARKHSKKFKQREIRIYDSGSESNIGRSESNLDREEERGGSELGIEQVGNEEGSRENGSRNREERKSRKRPEPLQPVTQQEEVQQQVQSSSTLTPSSGSSPQVSPKKPKQPNQQRSSPQPQVRRVQSNSDEGRRNGSPQQEIRRDQSTPVEGRGNASRSRKRDITKKKI